MIRLLKEKSVPKEVAVKFGEILFGDFRGENESDTQYENEVFNRLKSWIVGDEMGRNVVTKEATSIFKELKKLKQYYPDVLEPSSSTDTYYRAIVDTSFSVLEKLVPSINDFDSKRKIKGRTFYVYNNVTYTPKKPIESWTTSFENATIFGEEGGYVPGASRDVWAIVEAPLIDKNVLFSVNFMNDMSKYTLGTIENEVLRVLSSRKPIEGTTIYIPESALQ